MRYRDKLLALEEKALAFGKQWAAEAEAPAEGMPTFCPTEVVDLVIFHKLQLSMPFENALKSFRNLKTRFVDWNEVRVTSLREIQDVLAGAPESLAISVFIKEFLEFVHREQQRVSLEFLAQWNLGEIRKYLRQIRGLDPTTVNLVLRIRKDHPVVPLNRAMEQVLNRIGLLKHAGTREQKERALHRHLDPRHALAVHHFLLNHSQEYCPPDEQNLECERCCMRRLCSYYAWNSVKSKRRGPDTGSRGAARPRVAAKSRQGGRVVR